jgi:N-acetylglucosamine kinase
MIHCLDIGGSAIKAGFAPSPGAVTALGRVPTPLDDIEAFTGAITTALADAPGGAHVPLSISITGVVDPEGGRLTCANIPCINGRALAAELGARLSRPVHVANDADCFVLAEAGAGAGRGHRIVFGAILGTGVGGGLVIDGRLIVGAGGLTGEWGHGPAAATSAGTPKTAIPQFACGCGQSGCVDTIGGARGIERLHQHLHGLALPSTEIIAAWQAGEPRASRTIDCHTDLVASPLALVINITGASIVPVGGGLANASALIARIDTLVRQRILRRLESPIVVPGTCTVEPGLIGASILGFSA